MKKIFLLLFFSFPIFSQNFEVGGGLGTNWYKGDYMDWATRIKSKQILDLGPNINGYFGYQKTDQFLYKLNFDLGTFRKSNDYVYSPTVFNNETFSSLLINFSPSVDYNFFDYSSNTKILNWTPFTSMGLNLMFLNTDNPKNTPNKTNYFTAGVNFGFGAKMEINQFWGIRAEVITTKSFSDNFEGLSTQRKSFDFNLKGTDRLLQLKIGLTYKIHKIFCPTQI